MARQLSELIGKTIHKAELKDSELHLTIGDEQLVLWDDGQSCCEESFITCDDDVSSLEGNKLVSIQVKNAPDESADYDHHECAFVDIQTDGGFITLETHNIHNGYYGGFSVVITNSGKERWNEKTIDLQYDDWRT